MYISIMALPFQLPVDDTNESLAVLKPRAIIRKTDVYKEIKNIMQSYLEYGAARCHFTVCLKIARDMYDYAMDHSIP